MTDSFPVLSVTPAQWNAWLKKHHASQTEAFVLITKKGGGPPHLSYAEALDIALCWGWIDSVKRRYDERAVAQRFGPRRAQSPWSKINVAKAEALIAAGKMNPPGLREIERAKADGRWARAYAGSRTVEVPLDFKAALEAEPKAAALFAELDAANRYAMLFRVHHLKRPESRARRIEAFVTMLKQGKTLHPRKRRRAAQAP